MYVGTRQYPVDAASPDTGKSGVLVYWDSTPRVDATPGTKAPIVALDGKASIGLMRFTTEQNRGLRGTANLQGIAPGPALVVVPTTIGNETVPCYESADRTGFCDGPLLGAPMIGAPVLLGVNGSPMGRGVIQ